MTPEELEQALENFYGTQSWYRWSKLYPNILMTDGVKFLADNAKAYWLCDAIASHQSNEKVAKEWFQAWRLYKGKGMWILRCEDGNDRLIVEQLIEYTDFPLNTIGIWAIMDGSGNRILLLPNEY